MSENRINSKAFIPYFLSCVAYLAAYIIYALIPSSELANGLDHPGMTAVYVLTLSPVAAVISLILLILTFVLNKDYFSKLISKNLTVILSAILCLLVVIGAYFSVAFVAQQYKLGFVAPIYGTGWQGYSVYLLVSVILQFISLVLVTLKMKGIIKK